MEKLKWFVIYVDEFKEKECELCSDIRLIELLNCDGVEVVQIVRCPEG